MALERHPENGRGGTLWAKCIGQAHVDEMILAQPIHPPRELPADFVQHHKSLIQLDSMPLTVVERHRLDMLKSL